MNLDDLLQEFYWASIAHFEAIEDRANRHISAKELEIVKNELLEAKQRLIEYYATGLTIRPSS